MGEKTFTLPSFAKINWYLRVLGKRNDGFHELCTVFQTVSLHDLLSFSEADEIVLTCSDAQIPTDQTNLIIRSANALRKLLSVKKGARIHLEKKNTRAGRTRRRFFKCGGCLARAGETLGDQHQFN